MSNLDFNYHSDRSQRARIASFLDKKMIILLIIFTVTIFFAGVALLVFGFAVGWALVGLSFVPAMIIEWYEGELHHIPVSKKSDSIDGQLSGEILGKLPIKPTPIDLANIVGGLSGGYFFAVRFGISSAFLRDISSSSSDDIKNIWEEAVNLRSQTNSKNISTAIVVVALVRQSPNYKTLLNHLQLNEEDLLFGINWYNHLRNLSQIHKTPMKTGGLARDWSFGWTPLLDRFGQNISKQVSSHGSSLIKLITHEDSIDQLLDIFSKKGRQNAVLVGQSGSGKTEIIRAFAARLMDGASKNPTQLRYRQIFNLDASALIAAAPNRGGLEKLIPQVLGEAYSAKNVIICLDNAQLFFEDGVGSVDITNVLMPILEAGNLRIILTVDEQRYLQICKRNPDLANVLNRIIVSPASRDETLEIMREASLLIEHQNDVTFMYQSFTEAYRLGDRYIHDRVMPGKAIKLLESSAKYGVHGIVSGKSVQNTIEKTLNVKVGVANDDIERDKLLNLEKLIHGRMINQVRAVNVVSDSLRRARAGVRNQNRPIGTLLFLGPTGVGKTELAKSLAEVYFGGEDHIIRLDMNEYVSPSDVSRLIADGADNPNSLTSKVMKQPFSVILLDEIEKAHDNVLSTLLQLLDEGILRDVKDREISFRDAIIIATSNAGADRIREYIDRGYNIEQFEDKFVDELISSNQFRPEFLNRFDEIVMFRPLNKTELLKVVDLMIGVVNKTLSLQKVSVSVADDAKEYLVEVGYDPRLGARPIRRAIQKAVENTVAKQVLSGQVEVGGVVSITLDEVKQILDSKSKADKITNSHD